MGKLVIKNESATEFSIEHAAGSGTKQLVSQDFKYIRDTVSQLGTIPQPQDGEVALVKGYHDNTDNAGGTFIYRASMPKSSHNGGTIIDPSKTFPSFWNDSTQQSDWFTADSTGNGCWERVYDGAVNVKWFGDKGDGVNDSTYIFQYIIDNYKIEIPKAKYTFNKTLNIAGPKVIDFNHSYVEFHDADIGLKLGDDSSFNMVGSIVKNAHIECWTNYAGIEISNGWGNRLENVLLYYHTPLDSNRNNCGLSLKNYNGYWTEGTLTKNVMIRSMANGVTIDSNTGTNSFGFSNLELSILVDGGNNQMVKLINDATLYNSKLTIRGGWYGATGGNKGVLLAQDNSMFSGILDIDVDGRNYNVDDFHFIYQSGTAKVRGELRLNSFQSKLPLNSTYLFNYGIKQAVKDATVEGYIPCINIRGKMYEASWDSNTISSSANTTIDLGTLLPFSSYLVKCLYKQDNAEGVVTYNVSTGRSNANMDIQLLSGVQRLASLQQGSDGLDLQALCTYDSSNNHYVNFLNVSITKE